MTNAQADGIIDRLKDRPVDNSPRPYLRPEAPDPELTDEDKAASRDALNRIKQTASAKGADG